MPLTDEIKSLFRDVIAFVKDDLRLPKLLYALLFMGAILVAQLHYDVYHVWLAPGYNDGTSMLRLPLTYIMVYFSVLIPTLYLHGEQWRLKQWQVWVFPVLLLIVDGAGQGFYSYRDWINAMDILPKEKYYLKIVSSFFFRSVAIVSFVCIFRWMTTGRFGLFGLQRSAKYLRIYGIAYLCLVPVFIYVSTTPQFLTYYPRMGIAFCSGSFGWSDWKLISLFELCYGNDFLAVESMFRGALVIGMMRWLGPRAVLPMALTYMSIHLGKPDMELFSSVIGGYCLGILAYQTRHLWGGIIVHLGIAMLFEALGLFRYFLQ